LALLRLIMSPTRNARQAAPSDRTPIGCCSGERFWPGSTGIPPAGPKHLPARSPSCPAAYALSPTSLDTAIAPPAAGAQVPIEIALPTHERYPDC
jgi:hypothetical protein